MNRDVKSNIDACTYNIVNKRNGITQVWNLLCFRTASELFVFLKQMLQFVAQLRPEKCQPDRMPDSDIEARGKCETCV